MGLDSLALKVKGQVFFGHADHGERSPRGLLRVRRDPLRGPLVALAPRAGPPRVLGPVRRCTRSSAWRSARSSGRRRSPTAQATLDRFVTLGVIIHVLLLQLYADLGGRRDRAFRALVTGVLAFLAVLNLWVPLRGTVLELRTMPLPWGGTGLLPIRTPPGAPLAIQYLFVLAIQVYGFFVARAIWKRDRAGAVLVAIGAAAILAGFTLAVPRRLREGPGAVPGRLAARDQRALRGVLPLAGVLGARRAGGRHREAVRGRLRARPDRQGPPRARRTVSQGQPRALPHPRVDRRGARRTTAARRHAPGRPRVRRGGVPATAATSRPTPSRNVFSERTASPCGRSSPCRSSPMTAVGPSGSSLRCTT